MFEFNNDGYTMPSFFYMLQKLRVEGPGEQGKLPLSWGTLSKILPLIKGRQVQIPWVPFLKLSKGRFIASILAVTQDGPGR